MMLKVINFRMEQRTQKNVVNQIPRCTCWNRKKPGLNQGDLIEDKGAITLLLVTTSTQPLFSVSDSHKCFIFVM